MPLDSAMAGCHRSSPVSLVAPLDRRGWPAEAIKKCVGKGWRIPLVVLLGLLASCAEAQSSKGRDLKWEQLTEARLLELRGVDHYIRSASRRGDVAAFQALVAVGGIACMDGMAPRAAVVAAMADSKSVVWTALFGEVLEDTKSSRGDEVHRPSFRTFFAGHVDDEIEAYVSFPDPGRNVANIKWSSHTGDLGPSMEFLRRDGKWFITEWRAVCHLAAF